MKELKQPGEGTAGRVIDFLSGELAVPAGKIEILARLRQDLGVNGAAAANLLEVFSLTFDVDTDNFRVNDYFLPEGEKAPAFVRMLWVLGNGRPLKTLTVRDLIIAAEKKRLG